MNLLAAHMLVLQYHGTSAVHTASFDADGGTDTNGRLVLTDDDGATTIDCADQATLAELVAAINALTGWQAFPHPGLLSTTVTTFSDLTQRPTANFASATIDKVGSVVIPFANSYEIASAGTTTTLVSSIGIPLNNAQKASISLSVDGADAGATGNATFNFVSNHRGNPVGFPNKFPDTSMEAGWDTLALFSSSPVVAINGATEAKKTVLEDVYGIRQIKLLSVTNADDAVLNVYGSIRVAE